MITYGIRESYGKYKIRDCRACHFYTAFDTVLKRLVTFLVWMAIISSDAWGQVNDSLFNQIITHEDGIILDEKTKVDFSGVKSEFIMITVTKDITYLVRNDSAIRRIQAFKIPEQFDYFIQHAPDVRTGTRVSWSSIHLDTISVTLLNKQKLAKITTEVKNVNHNRVWERNLLVEKNSYCVYSKGLQVGDTVRIKYRYRFPFAENYHLLFSFRVFHHDIWPKKNYKLEWTFNNSLNPDTTFQGIRPAIQGIGKTTKMIWQLQNLPGCMDEPKGRPFAQLPWFIFTPRPPELLYTHFDSYKEEFYPIWLILSAWAENKIATAKQNTSLGLKTSDQLHFNRFADTLKRKYITDTTGLSALRSFQSWMCRNVAYDNSLDFYLQRKTYEKDRPGGNLAEKTLKDHNRELAYANMIARLGTNFSSAYPVDKRYGIIFKKYFAPVFDNDFVFLISTSKEDLATIYPISDNSRYYLNELPFYFEETRFLIIDMSHFIWYKKNAEQEAFFWISPVNKISDNNMKTNSMIMVNLDDKTLNFKTRLNLTGQYSTMMRRNYLKWGRHDPTLQEYSWKINQPSPGTRVLKEEITNQSDEPPFGFSVLSEYSKADAIQGTDTLSVDLSGCFRYCIPENMDFSFRFLDYYPDFTGTVQYSYMLQFDKPVRLLKPVELVTANNFGYHEYKTSQLGEDQILVTSLFRIQSKFVPGERINLVEELFSSATNPENFKITFTK